MAESTQARNAAVEEEAWDADEILDEAGITDAEHADSEAEGAVGPDELDDLSAEEAPTEESSEPPADAVSDPDAAPDTSPAPPRAATDGSPNASTDTPDTEPEPLTWRVDGTDVAPEGSYRIDGMWVIPEEVGQRLLRNNIVADRHEYTRRTRALEQELERTRTERTAQDAEVSTLLTHLRTLYEDPDALTDFLADFDRQKDIILAQAERDGAKLEAENLKKRQSAQVEQEEAAQDPVVRQATLQVWVDGFLAGEPIEGVPLDTSVFKDSGLTTAEVMQLIRELNLEDTLLVPATAAGEGAQVINGEGSRYLVDLERLYPIMRREAMARKQMRDTTRTVADTARTNASRINGDARKRHGPTVAADGSPTPASAPAAPQEIRSRRDLQRDLDELNIDDILR